VGHRAALDDSNSNLSAVGPVPSRYTDYTKIVGRSTAMLRTDTYVLLLPVQGHKIQAGPKVRRHSKRGNHLDTLQDSCYKYPYNLRDISTFATLNDHLPQGQTRRKKYT
jgi:hypothetical protein